MKFHDLGEKPSKTQEVASSKKPYYPSLRITIEQVPELNDYELGDEVEVYIVAKVIRESKREGEVKDLGLEMRKAAINPKGLHKEAEEKGVSMKSMREIDKFRKSKKKQ